HASRNYISRIYQAVEVLFNISISGSRLSRLSCIGCIVGVQTLLFLVIIGHTIIIAVFVGRSFIFGITTNLVYIGNNTLLIGIDGKSPVLELRFGQLYIGQGFHDTGTRLLYNAGIHGIALRQSSAGI